MSTKDLQESTPCKRKSLQTLQNSASYIENLVGRPAKSSKQQLTHVNPVDVEVKKKIKSTKSQETQTNFENIVTVDDLTNPDGASETYWKILAEKRQVALQETLDENEKLQKVIEDLKQQKELYLKMLEEANSFVEVIKEELANTDRDDTGIDVNDVSTADETAEDCTDAESEPNTSTNN